MTLLGGTRLGSYEILAPLGAGGMGEVYRFEREAKTISALCSPTSSSTTRSPARSA